MSFITSLLSEFRLIIAEANSFRVLKSSLPKGQLPDEEPKDEPVGAFIPDTYYPIRAPDSAPEAFKVRLWVVISTTQLLNEIPNENNLLYNEEDKWVYCPNPAYTINRTPHYQMCLWNTASLFPILNLYTAFYKFYLATQPLSAFEKKDHLKIRVLLVVTGILELTLIGAWIAHGIATAYFHLSSPPSHQEMLEASAMIV